MKMKYLKLTYTLTASLILGGCASDPEIPFTSEGDKSPIVTVSGAIHVPRMSTSETRGEMAETPGEGLKLSLLEFSPGTTTANTFITNIYNAETTSTTAVQNGEIVYFTVNLNKTTSPRRLHLMVADDYISSGFGSEATVLPGITVSDGREAYWGSVDFPNGYATSPDAEGNSSLLPEVAAKLTNVPVVRNFAKVSVTSKYDDFYLEGFELINVPQKGTIAPWNTSGMEIPELLDTSGKMKSYTEISRSYQGVIPEGTIFTNVEADARKWSDEHLWTTSDKYLYEHPYESTRRTYLIIKGRYRLPGHSAFNPTSYYKVDLGLPSATSMFDFYNIIRNIQYNVTINNVYTNGAANAAEAIDGQVYNNISASVETATMPNISDGGNMLIVNSTNMVFTRAGEQITLLYRYIKDVTGSSEADNNVPHIQGLTTGPVVASFTEADDFTDKAGITWKRVTITCNEPGIISRTQSFLVLDDNGLGRRINMTLTMPYTIENTIVYQGILNDLPTSGTANVIGSDSGDTFTLFFNLPAGMPESVFPLQFIIESRQQNIENNKNGTLLVNTGMSLFNPNVPAISYVKKVSYNEYMYKYLPGLSNELDVNSPNTDHLVRCRFQTISAGTEATQLKIYNSYFVSDSSMELTVTRQ